MLTSVSTCVISEQVNMPVSFVEKAHGNNEFPQLSPGNNNVTQETDSLTRKARHTVNRHQQTNEPTPSLLIMPLSSMGRLGVGRSLRRWTFQWRAKRFSKTLKL